MTLATSHELIRAAFPHFSILAHQFPENGFSLNAVADDSYLTLHYTEGSYVSIEGSFGGDAQTDPFFVLAERFIERSEPRWVARE